MHDYYCLTSKLLQEAQDAVESLQTELLARFVTVVAYLLWEYIVSVVVRGLHEMMVPGDIAFPLILLAEQLEL